MLSNDTLKLAFRVFTEKHSRGTTYRDRRDLPLQMCDLKFHQAAKSDPFEFEGYGSVWNHVDSYRDTMIQGCFADALKARRPMMFYGHNPNRVPGKWLSAKEDDNGLRLRGQLTPNHSEATDVEASLRHESLSGLSVGGYTTEAEWIEENGEITGRNVKKFDLYEVSIVSMPAEDDARVDGRSVKSVLDECQSLADFEDLLREVAGFSKSTATAFMTRACRIARGEPEGVAASKVADAMNDFASAIRGNPLPDFKLRITP